MTRSPFRACGLHQDYDDWLEELAPHEPISRGEFDGGRRRRVLVKIIGE